MSGASRVDQTPLRPWESFGGCSPWPCTAAGPRRAMSSAVVATSYGGPSSVAVTEVEVPSPGDGQVTIDVRAAAINPIDYKRYSGLMGADESQLPMRLGFEVSGVVSAVGSDAVGPAGQIRVGDEVIGYSAEGGFASRLNAPAGSV